MMVTVGCLQNFLMGGVIFGWAAISNTLLLSNEGAPDLRASHIHEMFVMASSANMCSPLFLGVVLDYFGPRACSIVSILISCAGFLLFGCAHSLAASRDAAEPIFTLAVIMIGFGGPGVQNAIIHLSNLYPANKSMVTGIITGCFQLSFCIFFVFDQLWFFGEVDYRFIFIAHAVLCVLCLLASAVLWPDKPFEFEEQVAEASPATRSRLYGEQAHSFKRMLRFPSTFRKGGIGVAPSPMGLGPETGTGVQGGFGGGGDGGGRDLWPPASYSSRSSSSSSSAGADSHLLGGGLPLKAPKAPSADLKAQPLRVQILSRPFFTATMLLTVASFWANFYIGAVDLQLQDEAFMDAHQQGVYMRAFTIVTVLGVLGIPFVGYAMDNWGFRVTLALTVTLGVAWAACTLVPNAKVLALSFCVYALFRTFTFNFFFAYVADSLGFRFFGILAGLSFFVAGVVGLLAEPLVVLAHGSCPTFPEDAAMSTGAIAVAIEECHSGNWRSVNLVKLVSLALLFFFPATAPPEQKEKAGQSGVKYGSVENMMPPRAKSTGQGPSYELVGATTTKTRVQQQNY